MDNQLNISVTGDNRGLIAGRDIKNANLINTGDVTGSYNAIGVGAQVIINQIQEARSAIAELSAEIRLAETQLADAVAAKIQKLLQAVEGSANLARSNPYRSLLDYRLEDAPYFYGRETAIRELLDKIHDHRLTILHADSGAGKSSLLQAGIGARLLAAGHLPLWLRPYREPVSPYIKRAFLTNLDALPELERFQEMPLEGFLDAVTDYLGDSTLYLFLDQFEEFFVEQPHVAQEQFIHDLADCLDETGLNVRWVLSMRKEYFSDLRRFQPRIEPFANEYFLPTFQLTEAKDVIIEPARKQGVDYESPALVDQILADLQDEDGTLQPPQVQLVCYTLFEEALQSETPTLITKTLYLMPRGNSGPGAAGILGSHLSRELAWMDSAERKLAQQILVALITFDARRGRRRLDTLLAELGKLNQQIDEDQVRRVLAYLVDRYLLHQNEDDDDEHPTYELTHDYLLAEIEVDQETVARKAAQELLDQEVKVYQQFGTLLNAERFEVIERWRDFLVVNQVAQSLLGKSQEALYQASREEIAQLQQRLWLSRGLIAALLAITLILSYNPTKNFVLRTRARTTVPLFATGKDIFEAHNVSNQRYLWCMEASRCPELNYLVRARNTNSSAKTEEGWEQIKDQPVTNVNIYEAAKFCDWIGRTLPTAQQWISVAPPLKTWSQLNVDSAVLCSNDEICTSPSDVIGRQIPQFPENAEKGQAGIFDLVGNVYEWTRTSVAEFDRDKQCSTVREADPLMIENSYVILGAGYGDKYGEDFAGRYANAGESQWYGAWGDPALGFRCVAADQVVEPGGACPTFR